MIRIDTGHGTITACSQERFERGDRVCVSVRPEAMDVVKEPTDQFSLMAAVTDSVFMGTLTKTLLRTDAGQEIKISRFETDGLMTEGSRVCLCWKPEKAVVLRPDRPDKKEG